MTGSGTASIEGIYSKSNVARVAVNARMPKIHPAAAGQVRDGGSND